MKGEDLGVLIVGNFDKPCFAAGGAKNFEDVAMVLDGAAVGGDGKSGLVEENDGARLGRIEKLGLRDGAVDPVGHCVLCGKSGSGADCADAGGQTRDMR